MMLILTGCSGGADTMTQPLVPLPAADLDTSRPPPTTVTSTPLLPPVPETGAGQPAATSQPSDTGEPPLQYEHLYSEEEQAKIAADLAGSGAKAQGN
jgi:hypothetical protein